MSDVTKTSGERLDGRTALITGGGAGIGRAITQALARLGAEVVVVGRDRSRLNETCALIAASGGRARAIQADICTEKGLDALREIARETDVLVNNAAAFAPYGELEEIDPRDAARVIDTVLTAPLRLTGAVLPGMKARRFGRIVNIGSIAATLGAKRQVVYTSAKSALTGFTRSVALEGARFGITCNLLEVGLVETDRVREKIPLEVREAIIRETPLGRPGTPEEIACVVAFLASPSASYVTGASIPVTGGLGLGLFPAGADE